MRNLSRILTLWLVFGAMAFVPAAHATVSAKEAKEIQLLVRAQLDAFAADDAPRAFSYAAQSIQQMFGTPDQFLQMVRSSYPVVYRPASLAFLKPEGQDDQAVQRVQMLDARGESWLAVYSLQRQKNKSWRITGCALLANKGRMA